jgi:hypothetical protein
MCICVIKSYYCKVVVGLETQLCTLRGVRGLGITNGMLTFDTKTSLGTGSGASSLLPYTLRYVCLAELGTLCQFGFREPMHLCACVSEEGGVGEGSGEGGDVSNVL